MSEMKFDRLKMYFGKPFEPGNGITVFIPTIGDILELSQSDMSFYQSLYVWVGNPTMYRLALWDEGIDWNKISDYQLFTSLIRSGDPDANKLLFGDLDLNGFLQYTKTYLVKDNNGDEIEKTEFTLYNKDFDIEISEDCYKLISEYLKAAFDIYPKVEKAKGRATKEAIIEEERMNILAKEKSGDKPSSVLLPLISACINHPGFKYDLEGLKNVNFVQFMDSVQRLQVYENSRALLSGSMSGFCDMSKVPKDEFNFMRDLTAKK